MNDNTPATHPIQWFRLISAIIICQLAGVIGAILTNSSVGSWYPTLEQPSFTPPDAVFPVVWTTLYLLMGVALYLVWRRGPERRRVRAGLFAFGIQLTLNVLWSFCFFGLRSPLLGLVDILLLLLAILWTLLAFARVSRTAARLMIPYLVWVAFAFLLNASIWWKNG